MKAKEKIERNRIMDVARTFTFNFNVCLSFNNNNYESCSYVTTGEVYEKYKELATKLDMEIVTSRRVSDILDELNVLGIISG